MTASPRARSDGAPATSDPESLLAVACPACHAALAVASDLIGAAARCPQCAKGFLVSTPPAQTAPEPPQRTGLDAVLPDVPAEPPAPRPKTELDFEEPVKTIISGDSVIQLRRLSPEEKAARRFRRNLVMLLVGALVLLSIVLLLGRK